MDEQGRLYALRDYHILDTPPESDYDRLASLAATICATPFATVTLVDEQRQWFKAAHGLTLRQTDRAIAFCAHAIEGHEPLVVQDTYLDPRFAQNPLVTDSPHLRFYAGIPLITPDGFALGTLAVMDTQARELHVEQLEALTTLAHQVMVNLELRRQRHAFESHTRERVRHILSAAATGIAVANLEGQYLLVNPAYCKMLGFSEADLLHKTFTEILYPDDLPKARQLINGLLTGKKISYTHEIRCVKNGGAIIWVRASVSLIYNSNGQVEGMVAVTDDITTRKKIEQKNRQLSKRLTVTLESITDAFLTIDTEWNFTYMNSEAERLLARRREDTLGKNVWQVFPEAVGSAFEQHYRQAVTEGRKVSFESYFPPLDTWFSVNAYPSPEGLAIYFQGINERIKSQEQLRLLDACVTRMNDMVVITEAERIDEPGPKILFVNNAFVSRTGYSREEILGRSPRFLQGPDTQRGELDRIRAALATREPVRAEIINYTKTGEAFWLEMDIVPVTNERGLVTHYVGVGRDITQRKKAEQKIQESEKRFKLVARATADAIWDWDLITDQLWWSEGIHTLFGLSLDELEPSINSWTARIHADDRQAVVDHIYSVINGAEENWIHEYRFQRKDNTYAYVQDRGFVIRNAEGKAVRMLGGMTDLTASKQAEYEMARINELKHAQQIAELASQTKSNFLATMSHEIRTPISGVIGMVDVLHQTSLKGYQVEMLDIIRDSAYSLLGIIDDILDFSKIEAGRMDIESAPLSLTSVVKSVCVMLDRFAENKGVELTLFIDPALPETLLGDSLRVRQVLVNLINNAIKFSGGRTSPGKVSIRTLLIQQQAEDVMVEFRITDNGIGMSTETLGRLFTPFVQADTSTTRQFGGTGLGLTISRHLVDLMKGEIRVRSEPDKGSEFSVVLPFATMPSMEDAGDSLVTGLQCIVLGDEKSLADDLASYLKAKHADVVRVCSLTQLQEQPGIVTAPAAGLWVWITDVRENDVIKSFMKTVAESWPHLDIRWLLIGRGQRRKPRRERSGVVTIDGNLLDSRTFLRAVAIVAGRAEEEKTLVNSGKQESAFLPPPRELALQQKRLVLVAEDNETNQKVILRQLALLGYAADVVPNGREALIRWQSGDYSLLLTDLHMPEMDGYDLAKAIRALENGYGYIPIIALSANALRGEAERCRELGMDEYLSKPASLTELQTALERWLPMVEPDWRAVGMPTNSTPGASSVCAPAVEGARVINIHVLEELVGDEPDVVREFLQDFRRGALQMAEELRRAHAAQKRDGIASIAHKLKSSARSVGAFPLGDACENLEMLCNRETATSLIDSVNAVDAAWMEVNQHIDELLKKLC